MSLRYLLRAHRQAFVSVVNVFACVGVTIGVAALIIVMSVMNGFRDNITSYIFGVSGHIVITGNNGLIEDYIKKERSLSEIPKIDLVLPSIQSQAMVRSSYRDLGVSVQGMRYNDLYKRGMIFDHIVDGAIDVNDYEEVAFIGRGLADNLNVGVGDMISIIAPGGMMSIVGFLPLMKEVRISGIYNSGIYDRDNSYVYIPIELSRLLFGYEESVVNTININVSSDRYTQEVADVVSVAMNDVNVSTWHDHYGSLFHALRIERNAMLCILSLIVVVALFNIISGLFMLVYDKWDSIAILRTMGASSTEIMAIFISCGMAIGCVGLFFGVLAGCLIAVNIQNIRALLDMFAGVGVIDSLVAFLSDLPAVLLFGDVVFVVLLVLLCSVVAVVWPARRAASIQPGDVLRRV